MEDVNERRRISVSLSKVECAPQEINFREIRLHLPFSSNWNKRDSVWKTGIHFKSDVFTAVAVVDAKAPSSLPRTSGRTRERGFLNLVGYLPEKPSPLRTAWSTLHLCATLFLNYLPIHFPHSLCSYCEAMPGAYYRLLGDACVGNLTESPL